MVQSNPQKHENHAPQNFCAIQVATIYALSAFVILHRLTFAHFCFYTCEQVMEVEGRL